MHRQELINCALVAAQSSSDKGFVHTAAAFREIVAGLTFSSDIEKRLPKHIPGHVEIHDPAVLFYKSKY